MKRNITLAPCIAATLFFLTAAGSVPDTEPAAQAESDFPLSAPSVTARVPRLVVNIIVGGMRPDYLDRYADHFSTRGFRRLLAGGAVFGQARYEFMQTNRAATLATLTTGTDPAMHGVTGPGWVDYVTGRKVELIADPQAEGLECEPGANAYSPVNLTVPTLGDRLRHERPRARYVSVAMDPVSAVVLAGTGGEAFWFDPQRGIWTTSTAYSLYLPEWAAEYNALRSAERLLREGWKLSLPAQSYVSRRYADAPVTGGEFRRIEMPAPDAMPWAGTKYGALAALPGGIGLTAEFVRQAVIYGNLGADDVTDVLNVCFDTPRTVASLYGPESVETEEVYCRLDEALGELIDFTEAQFPPGEVLWVLTSDHGTSDSYDVSAPARERFNAEQFAVIVNSFLCAQYGGEKWVRRYGERQLWIDRTKVYASGRQLDEVLGQVAAFVLQFRGVAHAVTSTAMQGSYFGDSYGRLIQNGFYPKRSGDITIDLAAGWTEEGPERSSAGSLYGYDRHVPLVFYGCGISPEYVDAPVNMARVAPTLARIMGIDSPIASTAEPIAEVSEAFADKR